MGKGRSLELYFIDGKPDGMLTAEVFNWTGHVLKTPRTKIVEALKRPEAKYTGIYILLGETDSGPLAYIGEAEDMASRLRDHVAKKDWWEEVVLVTSSANNLHKAHIKYLESRLVEKALAVRQIPLENGNQPARSSLSESAIANMESFLDTLEVVLPAIQVNMFVDKRNTPDATATSEQTKPVFELINRKYGINATAVLTNGEMVVLAGSKVGKEWTGTQKGQERYMAKHLELSINGQCKIEGGSAEYLYDYAFSSPSLAAMVVSGRYATRNAWKLKGTNKTYAAWEAEQIEKDS